MQKKPKNKFNRRSNSEKHKNKNKKEKDWNVKKMRRRNLNKLKPIELKDKKYLNFQNYNSINFTPNTFKLKRNINILKINKNLKKISTKRILNYQRKLTTVLSKPIRRSIWPKLKRETKSWGKPWWVLLLQPEAQILLLMLTEMRRRLRRRGINWSEDSISRRKSKRFTYR